MKNNKGKKKGKEMTKKDKKKKHSDGEFPLESQVVEEYEEFDGIPDQEFQLEVLGLEFDCRIMNTTPFDIGFANCSIQEGIINVNNWDISPDQIRSSLIHELVEVFNHRLELDLKHREIAQLETAFHDFIKKNPKVVDFLNGRTNVIDNIDI